MCRRPQTKDLQKQGEISSPTVATEVVFLTAVINALEGRKVAMVDIPGAFLHSYMDKDIHVKINGKMAMLLSRINKDKYKEFTVKKMVNW